MLLFVFFLEVKMNIFALFKNMTVPKDLTLTMIEKEEPVYTEEELLYLSAWEKIQEYINLNCSCEAFNHFRTNIITPNGVKTITINRELILPEYLDRMIAIKSIVDNWESIKESIERKIRNDRIKINNLMHFNM